MEASVGTIINLTNFDDISWKKVLNIPAFLTFCFDAQINSMKKLGFESAHWPLKNMAGESMLYSLGTKKVQGVDIDVTKYV